MRGPGRAEGWLLAGVVVVALVTTGVLAKSVGTWALEVVWVLAGLPLVIALRKRFPLTRLLCWLLVVHALVLCYGGQHTYAETPLGEWVQQWLGTRRNNYDRFAHVVQGFVPAVAVREVLLRRTPLRPGGWVAFLSVCVCLAISACFEFVEWFSAVVLGSGADDFLGTQGDQWDTQWDMFLCLCGAVISLLVWRRIHDRQLGTAGGRGGTTTA
ncbi:putative membrane protein [Lentzea xinjiangensis]|uniref:Putative membrane protein n=1 Tax=Lentzea xinjiangensis TaxID=402600 RepID=A0A1H9J2H8_9PSEU|nr:putative membrane protein [Lentzea xinjiangensis]